MPIGINAAKIRLIAGLGNPSARYKNSYHNIGLSVLDYLAETFSVSKFKTPSGAPFGYSKAGRLILVKPLVFMNESGRAIDAAVKFFGVKPAEIIIVHDDSDISLGRLKLSFGRGAAGHHGAESVIKKLNTKNFWRLRIGIRKGDTNHKKNAFSVRKKAEDFVLQNIRKGDKEIFHSVFAEVAGDIRKLIEKENP